MKRFSVIEGTAARVQSELCALAQREATGSIIGLEVAGVSSAIGAGAVTGDGARDEHCVVVVVSYDEDRDA